MRFEYTTTANVHAMWGLPYPNRLRSRIFRNVIAASVYASFDVYVAKGYDSENDAMDDWLKANKMRYKQRLMDGNPYGYDEKFQGDSEDSIVEIWIPIEKYKEAAIALFRGARP